MNYKESNMQTLSVTLKKLLDDPEVAPEELYELILLTVGENINTHRDAMDRAKTLRDKLMSDNGVSGFKPFTYDTISFGSDNSNDTIKFTDDNLNHSYHYFQRDRNR